MRRPHLVWIGISAACLALAMLVLAGCGGGEEPPTPEELLIALIEQAEAAAEAEDREALMALVSEEYYDARGRSKSDLDGTARFYFARNRDVYVLTTVGEITFPDSAHAEVQVHVAMAGEPIADGGALSGLRADLYEFDVTFADEGDQDWKVVRAQWRRAQPSDFLSPE